MKIYFVLLALCIGYTPYLWGQSDITAEELYGHIAFLTQEKWEGRMPGSRGDKKVGKYIQKNLRQSKIKPLLQKYPQPFPAKLRTRSKSDVAKIVNTTNIIGYIPGTHPSLKNEYIVLGAHYDHLGWGGPSSKAGDTTAIHFGADDNASGVAAILEIGEKLSLDTEGLSRSILIVAFGAEEQGLLGSKFFTTHPPVPLENIVLMMNLDMVGRLNQQKHLYIGGAGTFPNGVSIMKSIGENHDLNLVVHAGGVGGSDHVSFYQKGISVMGLYTGGHPQYHTPDDTIEKINFKGMDIICDYIYDVLVYLAQDNTSFQFIPQK